ncbi:DUF4761 family protein [Escherichia marmotae]|nr:DUF4761 family protein [Escherichia marmotae]
MAKVLNTYEQADFERLAAFYPYRNEHGLPVLEDRLAASASRRNIRYSLSETHATPDGHTVKQIGEHAWLIEKAGIVVHKCPRNPFTGNRIFALSCGDNQFGQDFTLYEALRTVDRLLRGQSFIKKTDL